MAHQLCTNSLAIYSNCYPFDGNALQNAIPNLQPVGQLQLALLTSAWYSLMIKIHPENTRACMRWAPSTALQVTHVMCPLASHFFNGHYFARSCGYLFFIEVYQYGIKPDGSIFGKRTNRFHFDSTHCPKRTVEGKKGENSDWIYTTL